MLGGSTNESPSRATFAMLATEVRGRVRFRCLRHCTATGWDCDSASVVASQQIRHNIMYINYIIVGGINPICG